MAPFLPRVWESSLIALGLASGVVAVLVVLRWYCLLCSGGRGASRRMVNRKSSRGGGIQPAGVLPPGPRSDDADEVDIGQGGCQRGPPPRTEGIECKSEYADDGRESLSSSLNVETGGDPISRDDPEAPASAPVTESPPTPRTRITVVVTPPPPPPLREDDPTPVRSSRSDHRAPHQPQSVGSGSSTAADAKVLAKWKQRAARSFNAAAAVAAAKAGPGRRTGGTTDSDSADESRLGIVPCARRNRSRYPNRSDRSDDGTDAEDDGGVGTSSIYRRWLGPPTMAAAAGRSRGPNIGAEQEAPSFDSSAASAGTEEAGAHNHCRRLGIVPLWAAGCVNPKCLMTAVADLPPAPDPPSLPDLTGSASQLDWRQR